MVKIYASLNSSTFDTVDAFSNHESSLHAGETVLSFSSSPLFLLLLCSFSFSSFSFSTSLRTLSFFPYLPFNSPPPFLLPLSAFHLFLPLFLYFKFPFISTHPLPPLKVSLYQLSWPLLTLPFSFNTLDSVFLMMEITTYAHGAGEINIWWPPH